MDIEFRSYGFDEIETREVDDHTGHVSAHFSVFGNVDSYGTIVDKGAFKKTINDNKGKFAITWFHMPEVPVGLGLFEEDDKGLRADTDVDLDVQAGHDTFSGIKRGYIDCCSIGFKRITEVLKKGVKHLTELKLYEGAFLTRGFAANALAKIDSVRAVSIGLRRVEEAIQEGAAEELQEALDNVRNLLAEMGDGLLVPALDYRPYPNEHSCRLLDPKQFVRYFRKTVTDSKEKDGYKPTGKKYVLLIGYRKDNSSDVQSHHYPKGTWTAAQARKHCTFHDGKSFEPAKRAEGDIGEEILEQVMKVHALLRGDGPPDGTPTNEEPHLENGPREHPDPLLEGFRQLGRGLRETLKETR